MNLTQDMYNKLITTALLVYCMFMFSFSWALNKPLDLQGFLILVAPLLTHVVHLVSNKVPDTNGATK